MFDYLPPRWGGLLLDMPKEAYWFSHDSNAKTDTKILRIRAIYGWAGYGMYFGIVEVLREQNNFRLLCDEGELQILAKILEIEWGKFISFYRDCLRIGLFTEQEGWFFSQSLNDRQSLRLKQQQNGSKGGRGNRKHSDYEEYEAETKPKQSQVKAKTKPHTKIIKEIKKEIKEKEEKGFAKIDNKKPEIGEVRNYFYEKGREKDFQELAENFMRENEEKYQWRGLAEKTWQELADLYMTFNSVPKTKERPPKPDPLATWNENNGGYWEVTGDAFFGRKPLKYD